MVETTTETEEKTRRLIFKKVGYGCSEET